VADADLRIEDLQIRHGDLRNGVQWLPHDLDERCG
jgi:hypothetical protein